MLTVLGCEVWDQCSLCVTQYQLFVLRMVVLFQVCNGYYVCGFMQL